MSDPQPATLRVERVFPVTFLAGPIVWGTVTGVVTVGDEVTLARRDGPPLPGRVLTIDFNRPPDARDDQIGIAVTRRRHKGPAGRPPDHHPTIRRRALRRTSSPRPPGVRAAAGASGCGGGSGRTKESSIGTCDCSPPNSTPPKRARVPASRPPSRWSGDRVPVDGPAADAVLRCTRTGLGHGREPAGRRCRHPCTPPTPGAASSAWTHQRDRRISALSGRRLTCGLAAAAPSSPVRPRKACCQRARTTVRYKGRSGSPP